MRSRLKRTGQVNAVCLTTNYTALTALKQSLINIKADIKKFQGIYTYTTNNTDRSTFKRRYKHWYSVHSIIGAMPVLDPQTYAKEQDFIAAFKALSYQLLTKSNNLLFNAELAVKAEEEKQATIQKNHELCQQGLITSEESANIVPIPPTDTSTTDPTAASTTTTTGGFDFKKYLLPLGVVVAGGYYLSTRKKKKR